MDKVDKLMKKKTIEETKQKKENDTIRIQTSVPLKLRKDHSTGSRVQFQASKVKLDVKQNEVSRS